MTDQPQDFAVVQNSTYLQQLILHDMLAKVIEAQRKGGDNCALLKSLRDYASAQAEADSSEQHLFAAILSTLESSRKGSELP